MKLQFDKMTPFANNNYTSKNKSVSFSNVKISSNTVLEKHQAKLDGAVKLVELTKNIVASDKNFYKVLNVSKKD